MWKLPLCLKENEDLILLPKWSWLAVSEMSQVILAYPQGLPWNSTYLPSVHVVPTASCPCHVSTTQLYNLLTFHPRSICSVLSKLLLKPNEVFSYPEVSIHFYAFPRISRNNTKWRPALFFLPQLLETRPWSKKNKSRHVKFWQLRR